MHIDTFDRYQAGRSLVHRLDPRAKLVLTALYILSNALLPDGAWLAFGLSWVWLLLAGTLSRLGFGYTFKRSFVALPFALAAVSAIFALPGRPLLALHIGPWELVATAPGVARFTSIVIRSWLSVQAAILLTATTPFPDLMHALRHLRVPAVLTAIVSFMYRYLFVLADEVVRLLRAREARSARRPLADGRLSRPPGLLWQARVAGNMAGQLFLRSYERSDRIYQAMLARGYQGQFMTLNPHVFRPQDSITLALGTLTLLFVQVMGRLI